MRQKPALLLVSLTFLVLKSQSFELQDTIHALIEENIHLHDQLENLTQALRELKRMLWQHGNNPDRKHDEAVQHLWDEWSQLGISAETHLLLEHVFCGYDVPDSAAQIHDGASLLLLGFPCVAMLLLSCS
nr:uncharacterized protein LOC129164431 isoform X2 [Nothobranchius furzeri]